MPEIHGHGLCVFWAVTHLLVGLEECCVYHLIPVSHIHPQLFQPPPPTHGFYLGVFTPYQSQSLSLLQEPVPSDPAVRGLSVSNGVLLYGPLDALECLSSFLWLRVWYEALLRCALVPPWP